MWSHFVRDTSKKKCTYSNRPELEIAEFWRHLPVETLTLTVFKLPPFTFKTPLVTYYCNKTIPESLLLPTISEVRALGQINFIFSWFVCKYVNLFVFIDLQLFQNFANIICVSNSYVPPKNKSRTFNRILNYV